jgi:EamA domain-containing membrane protein RarD
VAALLVAAGAVTAIPLLFLAGAANRIPLTGMGVLQYITPTLQLACGVLIFHEPSRFLSSPYAAKLSVTVNAMYGIRP